MPVAGLTATVVAAGIGPERSGARPGVEIPAVT